MAYPPSVPANTRSDSTPSASTHPSDHNAISNALTDIINELGGAPRGSHATVQARFTAHETAAASGDTTLSRASSTLTTTPEVLGTHALGSVTYPRLLTVEACLLLNISAAVDLYLRVTNLTVKRMRIAVNGTTAHLSLTGIAPANQDCTVTAEVASASGSQTVSTSGGSDLNYLRYTAVRTW